MGVNGFNVRNRIIAALLSVVLATSGVPTAAWAEAASVAAADSAIELEDSGATDASENGQAQGNLPEEADEGAAGTVTSATDGGLAAKVVPQVRSTASASATAASTTFSSYDDVYIESSADSTGGYNVSGSITAGTTVYAHVYDYSEDERIEPSADWTYQWYALSYQYGSVSDENAIAGATSESFTPTEDLNGKYLKVKVTCSSSELTSSGVGPVKKPLAAGAVTLYSVELSGEKSVGSTITATAYEGSYSSKTAVTEGVTYTWRYSDSKPSYSGTSWTTIEGVTGNTLELTEAYKGKYISVVANAGDNDVTAGESSYGAFGPVLGEGEVELYSVELVDAPSEVEVGTTLTAQAYAGSYSSKTPVTKNVTYAWRCADSDPSSYSFDESSWTAIEGQTGPTLTVDESLVGKYISVTASAGANTVKLSSYRTAGPVKLAGAVEIYSAYLTKAEDSISGTVKYTADDTLWAQAKEKGSSETIDPSKLVYQWQVSDDNSTWTDIQRATGQSLSLASYEGRYVRCHVSAQVGDSSYDTRSRNKVAASGTVDVTSVKVDKTGALQVGDTLTATATDGDGSDVTNDTRVVWQWYASDTSTGTGQAIEGASGTSLTVTEDLLGKYVIAHANGSAGAWSDVTSSAAGPVKVAGAVILHHVEASGKAVVGGVVTAQAYTSSYTTVDSSDKVLYQWQYADTKSTSDTSFFDIPSATGATYEIPESFEDANGNTVSLIGKYLRVKATSDGSVVSTSQKSYYSSRSVDPLGPVSLMGGYDLTGVKVTSSKTNAQVGATLSAVAQYLKQGSYSSYNTDVPDDAQVTYNWYAAQDASGTNRSLLKSETITGSSASTYTLTTGQEGGYVWVEAVAKMQPASSDKALVVGEDSYSLHHVNLAPSSQTILTGSEVSASVYASQMGSTTNTEVTGREGVSVQWYEADAADAANDQWTAIEGANESTLTVPAAAVGKYLRAVATSGSTSVTATFDSPVVDSASLEGAQALLQQDYGWRPTLTYGTDTNINEVLKASLEEKGFDTTGLSVKVEGVEFSSTDANAQVGIATDDSEANGDITYFYVDPSQVSSWSVTGLRTVRSITFELSREGQTVEYTPSRTFQIPWDEAKLAGLLQQKADEIAIGYAEGDSAESVTGNLTLPYRAGTDGSASWASVTWSSKSDAVAVSGYGWSNYTGTVSRGSSDQQATLTATVAGNSNYDMPEGLNVTREFSLTIKADPEKVSQETAELQQKLDDAFTYENVTSFATGAAVDPEAISGDLQMPTPRKLGVDGKYYSVAFSADDGAIAFNGYHATVVRPLASAKSVNITCAITSKDNPEIAASKVLSFTLSPVPSSDIDAEVTLLDRVEAAYKSALLGVGGTTQAEPVGSNLATFQKAYLDEDGNLVFARSVDEASGHEGIVPVELPGYDSMGSYDQARLFKSSNTSVVLNETLQLAWNAGRSTSLSLWHEQPYYNTEVTISSRLASERFGAYYAHYQNDASVDDELKAKLLRLAGTDVSASINVAGTSGAEELKVSGTAIGEDARGQARTWAVLPATTFSQGSTAEQVVRAMLESAGLAYEGADDGAGWRVSSITKDGRLLASNSASGKSWQLFVNGDAYDGGLDSYLVQPGDELTLAYTTRGGVLPTPVTSINVTASVVGEDEQGYGQTWAANSAYRYDEDEGATAETVFKSLLDTAGLSYEASDTTHGWILSSISKDGRTLGRDASTGKFWQLFVNGKASEEGLSSYTLKDGDTLTLAYSRFGDSIPTTDWVEAQVSITGEDAQGASESWASSATYTLPAGSTARVAVERLLASAGLSYEASGSGSGYYLATITKDGRTLGWNESTGKFWQFFVNGVSQDVGLDVYVIQPGDVISLTYSAFEQPTPSHDTVATQVSVVGEDAQGQSEAWAPITSYELPVGSTAREAVEKLLDDTSGLTYEASGEGDSWYLLSISKGGLTLAYDATTGKYWQFFVNGKASTVGMGGYVIQPGDVLTLAYAADGESVPSSETVNGVEVHPEKERPTSIASDWPSFLGKDATNYTEASTPTSGSVASANWPQKVLEKQPGVFDLYASDPILVGGKVIVASGDQLLMLNATTGEVERTAKLVTKIDSTCRMVYADGIIVVPLHAGVLQALTADDLTTVWITQSVDGSAADGLAASLQQSLSTLTVAEGYVYVGTTNAGGTSGSLRRVSLADGSVSWSFDTSDSGYYWCGGVVLEQGYLIARSFGEGRSEVDLMSLEGNAGKGEVLSSVELPSTVRSTVVVSPDHTSAFVVARDGTLYKISIGKNGSLGVAGSVRFAGYSTSTPTLVDGKLVVGGADASSGAGGVYVIDAESLEVLERATTLAGGSSIGEVKSSPLVVRCGNDLYAYFSAESAEGGLYVYKLGGSTIQRLYLPASGQVDYSMSSVVCAPDGSLYYTNDSGYLFKVAEGTALPPQFDFSDPGVALTTYGVLKVENGSLGLYDASTGATISTVELGAANITGIQVTQADKGLVAYLVDAAGRVYDVTITESGALALVGSTQFAESGSGAPSLVDGKLYVWDASGNRYTLDSVTLKVQGEEPLTPSNGSEEGGHRAGSQTGPTGTGGTRGTLARSSGRPSARLRSVVSSTSGTGYTQQSGEPAMAGGTQADDEAAGAPALLGAESSSAVATSSSAASEDAAAEESDSLDATNEASQTIPWWPIVGIVVAVVVLVVALRRGKGHKEGA